MIDYLATLGYIHQGFTTGTVADGQVRYMVVLDLEGKSEKDIIAGFEANTRRTINRANKFGLEIEELTPDNLKEFIKMMDVTGKKRHFTDMGEKNYRRQMHAFGKDAMVWLSILNTDTLIEINQKEMDDVKSSLVRTEEALAKTPNNGKMLRRKKEEEERIRQIESIISETNQLKEKYGQRIPLSGAYFIHYDDEMYYISSGSYDEFRKYCGPYHIQEAAIRYALEHHCHRYNFTGTSGIFNDSADDYGVFKFKKSLGGRPIELLGEFILPCDEKACRRIRTVQKIKNIIKK